MIRRPDAAPRQSMGRLSRDSSHASIDPMILPTVRNPACRRTIG
jgi:hypothetical protein